jgi:hypothetical protein
MLRSGVMSARRNRDEKIKQSLYFPADMLDEIISEAERLDRPPVVGRSSSLESCQGGDPEAAGSRRAAGFVRLILLQRATCEIVDPHHGQVR